MPTPYRRRKPPRTLSHFGFLFVHDPVPLRSPSTNRNWKNRRGACVDAAFHAMGSFSHPSASNKNAKAARNEITTGTLIARHQVVPICQPRSALKGPVLVPRARGFLMSGDLADLGPSSPKPKMRSVRPLVAPLASEFVPSQRQLDQALPVGAFRCRGPLHCGLGFMLWVVLGTHEADPSRPSGQAHGNFVRKIAGCRRRLPEDALIAKSRGWASFKRSVNGVTVLAWRLG